MIDAKMKRTMKWHTEGYVDADVVREVAAKKALENMSTEDLKLVLNAHYGINPEPNNPIIEKIIIDELQRRNEEES